MNTTFSQRKSSSSAHEIAPDVLSYFNIGYALFVIVSQCIQLQTNGTRFLLTCQPSQIMMTRFRPSLWLPGLEFAWGVLTIAFYQVKSAKEIFAFRAFIGAMEGSAYPGGATLLMAWYTPRELAFRIGFFHSSAYSKFNPTSSEGKAGLTHRSWQYVCGWTASGHLQQPRRQRRTCGMAMDVCECETCSH